ncbi:MAG TPA: DUF4394 domain-containing protein [Capillimicrobium sp.]|nr:DUF4394 domain-containing protein [Capillimicrobium sp.]
MIRRRALRALLVCGLLLVAPASAQAAEQFAALTSDGQIVLFRSDSPGKLQGAELVTGLQPAETLLGLDVLPSNGRLYALGSTNRIYVVNPVTGAATPVSNTPFSPPLNGQTFTFGIDPTTAEARVVSNTGQDLRISVANGQVTGVDAPYGYVAGDPGFGTTPLLAALAYTIPPLGSAGAPSFYAIDTARDALVTSATQAATVRTIGELGVEAVEPAALDVTAEGTAFAALRRTADADPQLYTIDLSTGTAVPVPDPRLSTIAPRTSSTFRQDTPVIAMAALGDVPDDERNPRVTLAVDTKPALNRLLRRGLKLKVACSEACTTTADLTVRGISSEQAEGQIVATAGDVKLRLELTGEAKDALRERPTARLNLRVVTTDAAGNRVTIRRQIRALFPQE